MTKTVNIYINDLMHIQVNKTNNYIYILLHIIQSYIFIISVI